MVSRSIPQVWKKIDRVLAEPAPDLSPPIIRQYGALDVCGYSIKVKTLLSSFSQTGWFNIFQVYRSQNSIVIKYSNGSIFGKLKI